MKSRIVRAARAVVDRAPFLRSPARRAWRARRRLARWIAAAGAALWLGLLIVAVAVDALALAVALIGLAAAAAVVVAVSTRRRFGAQLAAAEARTRHIEVVQRRVLAAVERERLDAALRHREVLRALGRSDDDVDSGADHLAPH